MEWNTNEIEFFPSVIVRTPAMALGELDYSDDAFREMLDHPEFARALYLANPNVFAEAKGWIAGEEIDPKREKKLKTTLFNYWTRVHTNSTPFGFFANVGTAQWDEETKLVADKNRPAIRLDYELLQALVDHINQIPDVKNRVKFYKNNTCYEQAGKIRYNEIYFEGKLMRYKLSAIETNEVIDSLLNFSKSGKTITELADFIYEDGFDYNDVIAFVLQLIDEQLLHSELNLNVTGQDPLERIIDFLKGINQAPISENINAIIQFLKQTQSHLDHLMKLEGEGFIAGFDALKNHLLTILPEINDRTMIQVDCFVDLIEGKIDKKLQSRLYEVIKVMGSFVQNDYMPFLENFKKKFRERYENAIVPLMEVIDTESGISFGEFEYINDNVYLSDIMFGKEEEKGALKDEVNETKFLLYRRFIECINNNGTVIHLKKEDFKDIESNSVDRLAQTGQIIFHYVDKDKDTLCLTTIGNSCGANLIARFAYGKEEIEGLYHQVTDFETAASDNAITAEIVHLPEHRIGNLSFRPASREYEIPIVNHSVLDDEHQVNLEDLYVTVQGNTIRLLSKKHGKYVFPKLTNAHNYSRNTLPIYQFLSELSYQHLIPSLSLRRGIIGYMQKIIPRIQYENVILAKATWRLEYSDFQSLIDKKDGLMLADLEAFREKWQLPIFTDYKYGAEAKSILIKWDNLISVHHFLSKLKDDGHALYLTEFPYDAESGVYTNVEGNTFHTQVIAVFKNHAKKPQRYFGIPKIYGEEDKQRNFFPADDWLYFKIYSGNQTYNKLMSEVIQPLVHKLYEQNLIEKCFYLPFTDPNFHLRIRFKASGEQRGKALEFISDQINQSIYAGLIDRIQLDTYKRELERYGNETMDIAESVFSLDSRFIINNHQWLIEGHNYQLPFLVMKQIDTIIDAFGQDFEFKFKLMEAIKESYLNEFGVGKKSDLKKILDKKLLDTRKEIEQIMVGQIDFLSEDQLNYYEASLQNYGKQLKTIYEANEAVLNRPDFLFRWLRSILHMHCIRCFFDRPRQNELFVYNGLFNYYRKLYFTSKKAKSKKAVAK